MKQLKKEMYREILGVEEYLERRREFRKEEIKKEQEKHPEPFMHYSSFLFMTL